MTSNTLDDVFDALGFGAAQLWTLLTAGLSYTNAGSIKIALGVVAMALASEWTLSPFEKGSLVSVVFLGQMVGNIVSGAVADRFGRRPPLLLAVSISTFAALGSSLATSYGTMLAWRLLMGFGFGFGTGPYQVMCAEMCPKDWRIEMICGSNLMFILGLLMGVLCIWQMDPEMREIEWRRLTVLTALPGVCYLVAMQLSVLESPRFLAQAKQRDQAEDVLRRMQTLNGPAARSVDVTSWTSAELTQQSLSFSEAWSVIWSREMMFTTSCICLSCFNLNYAYYGMMYGLPQVLPKVNLGIPAAGNVLVSILGEGSGYIFGSFMSSWSWLSRINALLVYLTGLTTCVIVFIVSLMYVPDASEEVHSHHTLPITSAMVAVYGCMFFVAIGFLLVYTYACEVYPTTCRTFGCSVCIGAGRLGSILCPLIFEGMHELTGDHVYFFMFVVALCMANALLVTALPVETKDRQLGEIAAEVRPLALESKAV